MSVLRTEYPRVDMSFEREKKEEKKVEREVVEMSMLLHPERHPT